MISLYALSELEKADVPPFWFSGEKGLGIPRKEGFSFDLYRYWRPSYN